LLKALDRVVGEDDTTKNRLSKTNRILDGISTHIKNSESYED